jgi:hypothetical protein
MRQTLKSDYATGEHWMQKLHATVFHYHQLAK